MRFSQYFILFSILFFSVFCLESCSDAANRAYKKGLLKQQQGESNYAIEYYKLSLEKGGNKGKLNYLIAENYRQTNRLQDALKHYAAAVAAGSKEDKAIYYLAQALKTNGQYLDAKDYFTKYANSGLNKTLAKQAKAEADFLARIDDLRRRETFYHVQNAGTDINTDGPEYAPLFRDGKLIYTASNNQFQYTAIGSGFTDIYQFKFDGIGDNTGVKKEFGEKINKNKTHEACAAISPDGGLVIFARSNDGKRKGAADIDLYITELRDEEWSEPVILSPISDPRAWESCPALSPDGKTLIFASNRKGGYGGIDLYKSVLTDTSGWTAPINLGSAINTAGNEMFPSYRKDGKMFISSDGHPGLGGLDIFSVNTDSSGNVLGVENMGTGINSSADDFGITHRDRTNGYFASNRAGGKGDDDIYEFRVVIPPAPPVVKVTKSYLSVHIKYQSNGDTALLPVSLADCTLKSYGDTISKGIFKIADTLGTAHYEVDSLASYTILAEQEDFFSASVNYSIPKATFRKDSISPLLINKYYDTTIVLQQVQIGKEIVLEHIYYDYNKADIRLESEPDLKLLIDFMRKNPSLVIELGSHTDSRGGDEFNLKLSKARAKSAVDYIVKNGIDPKRIKPVGYGETKHKIKDAQTEEEHQINRRTEFRIVDVKN